MVPSLTQVRAQLATVQRVVAELGQGHIAESLPVLDAAAIQLSRYVNHTPQGSVGRAYASAALTDVNLAYGHLHRARSGPAELLQARFDLGRASIAEALEHLDA